MHGLDFFAFLLHAGQHLAVGLELGARGVLFVEVFGGFLRLCIQLVDMFESRLVFADMLFD